MPQHPPLRDELLDAIERCLADDANAWDMRPDGTWERHRSDDAEPRSVFRELMLGHAARAAEASSGPSA